ncbi:hypothetical protein TZ00_13740 [Agreia bicolorata]|uniref:Uncharacterized protein n=1 Tax=Agreia bicolorata TaxID=110935 RepID=A0ABR5CDN1_9MICO|nr:hypothetical protein TZ00_13740 [Agreia bicolorata]
MTEVRISERPRGGAGSSAGLFRSFHRARLRAALRVRVPLLVLASAALAAGIWGGITATPSARVDAATQPTGRVAGPAVAAPVAQLAGGATDPAAAQAAASPAVVSAAIDPADGQPIASISPVPAVPPQAATPVAPTPLYSISVTARGHQTELDACQWVRMDVGAIAPIVGAHNFCHGDIVLDMTMGEIVSVTGTDLDGDYQITGSRDARAGEDAARATAGLSGDLLFQTCYWDDARGLRLVTAVKVDLSLPPSVVG